MNDAPRPRGWQTVYTQEVADEICRRLSLGETLSEICKTPGMPPKQTVNTWRDDNREGFAIQYARAREQQIEHFADELLAIADDGTNDWVESNDPNNPGYRLNGENVQRSRLRSDNRKWLLSKLKPEKYGDKLALGADPKNPLFPNMTTEQLEAEAIRKLVALGISEEQAAAIVRDRKRS